MSTTTASRRIDPRALRDADADVILTATPASGTPASGTPAPQPASFVPAIAQRQLPIASIRQDGGTQPRAALNQAHINDLADDLRAGAILPPLDVMYDGGSYWLFDGYHRLHACKMARGDSATISVRVHQGSLADAQWASFAVNKTHGLRRTTEDKQRAIVAALRHANGVNRSNREIGRHLGVDDKTVGVWREKLESSAEIPQIAERTVTRGDQTYTQNTAEIGGAPRRETTASGLPKLDMPLRMVGDAPAVVASDATHTRQQSAPLGKCRICNRPLSDPAQAAQGIGACCAAKQAAGLAVDGDRPLPDWATDATDAAITDAAQPVQADDRRARLAHWQITFEQALDDLPHWAELTGRHVLIGEAERGLRKVLDATRSEIIALNGQPRSNSWGDVE